jgi:hypothetical protein
LNGLKGGAISNALRLRVGPIEAVIVNSLPLVVAAEFICVGIAASSPAPYHALNELCLFSG